MPISDDTVMTPGETARFLHIPISWVYRHARELGGFKVGKYLRFRLSLLKRYVESGNHR